MFNKIIVSLITGIIASSDLYGYDSLNNLGVLSSTIDREPQVIRVEKIKDQSESIVFKFCDNIASDDCIVLGRKQGYSNKELLALSSMLKLDSEVLTYAKPLYICSVYLVGIGVAYFSGGIAIPMLAASSSTSYAIEAEADFFSEPKHKEKMGKIVNPQSLYFPMKLSGNISIVDASYELEEVLLTLEDPCFVDTSTRACRDEKKRLLEHSNEVGKRFPYYIK